MLERCGLAQKAVYGRQEARVEDLRHGCLLQSRAATPTSPSEEVGRKVTSALFRESRGAIGRLAITGQQRGQARARGSQARPTVAPSARGLRREEAASKQTASNGKATAIGHRRRIRLRYAAATVRATARTEGRRASTAKAASVISDGGRGRVLAVVYASASGAAIGRIAPVYKANLAVSAALVLAVGREVEGDGENSGSGVFS